MATYKQVASRISAARVSIEKAVSLLKVLDVGSSDGENQFLQNELTRVAGRMEAGYNIAMDLEYRKDTD